MTMLELLKSILEIDPLDYSDMPDYKEVLAHLGLSEDADPYDVKDAVEHEIEATAEAEPSGVE